MTIAPQPTQPSHPANPPCNGYRLTVRGCLGFDTLLWLGYDARTHPEQNLTSLHLPTSDQAALYGVILKLRDLGLVLLGVEWVGSETPLSSASSFQGDSHGHN